MKNIKKEDWIPIVLTKAHPDGLTPVQLQKSLFLLQKAFPSLLKAFYNFQPHNYGPFDVAIYEDANDLESKQLIKKVQIENRSWAKYCITQSGQQKGEELLKKVDKKVVDYLTKLINWIHELSFQELITSIYKKYPKYKVNSVFRELK